MMFDFWLFRVKLLDSPERLEELQEADRARVAAGAGAGAGAGAEAGQ